jgi:hypothetical protein
MKLKKEQMEELVRRYGPLPERPPANRALRSRAEMPAVMSVVPCFFTVEDDETVAPPVAEEGADRSEPRS